MNLYKSSLATIIAEWSKEQSDKAQVLLLGFEEACSAVPHSTVGVVLRGYLIFQTLHAAPAQEDVEAH